MRIVFLALPALLMLSGCGLVGMIASGVSDGTKYVINRVERDPEIQARSQQGYGPAGGDIRRRLRRSRLIRTRHTQARRIRSRSYPDQILSGRSQYPTQQYPADQSGGATGAPAPLTARVQPVTRGEPLN